METKKQNKYLNILLIATFLIVIIFGFGKANITTAQTPPTTASLGTCSLGTSSSHRLNISRDDCIDLCTTERATNSGTTCLWRENSTRTWIPLSSQVQDILPFSTPRKDVCPNISWKEPKSWFNCILLYILGLLGMLLQLAGTIFAWIIDPMNVNSVINNEIIYSTWALVRDLLNVSFILFLLFSAFATVFQVDKYNYKKTLRTLILMALLVNFSYPITRFIIDLSNVLMFYLISSFNLKTSLFVQMAGDSRLQGIISPTGNPDTSFLLMSIIFLFIFTITLLVISLLFVIRTVVLAILVIFSSLAFIGEAIPPLSSYASDWWKKLFNYAFFGPAMVFMLIVSSKMMSTIGSSGFGNMEKIANLNSTNPNFIASISFFMIPTIILWMGIGFAQSMGIEGAGMITGQAKKFMGKVGKWTASAPHRGVFAAAKMTGIPGGAKEGWKNFKKTGTLFGKKVPLYGGSDQTERMEARFGGVFKDGGSGWTNANIELERKKVNETRKEWKDQGGQTIESLQEKLANGSKIDKKVAALELAENHTFKDLEEFQSAISAIGDDEVLKKVFNGFVKEKQIKFLLPNKVIEERKKATAEGRTFNEDNENAIYEETLDKFSDKNFAEKLDLDLNDEHVVKYIKKRFADPVKYQYVFSKLDEKKRKSWNISLSKAEKTPHEKIQEKKADENQKIIDKAPEFKSSYEEIQKERAGDADREIKKNFKEE